MIGRTHGVHAEPTTFGSKLAGWAFELDRDRARVARALEGHARRQDLRRRRHLRRGRSRGRADRLRAARPRAGAALDAGHPARPPRRAADRARDRRRVAREVRARDPPPARTEVREVEEPFGKGQKGSSAMPHKRNPIVSERICGLARVVRAAAVAGLENVALWHERDISHSSVERVVLPGRVPRRSTTCSTGSPGWWRGSSSSRAHAREPRREPRLVLQPAAAARARRGRPLARRGVPARAAARDARVGRGPRLPGARRAPTPRSRGESTSMPFSTSLPTHVTSTSSSSGSARSAEEQVHA